MSKVIGYMEGTDPVLLTMLSVQDFSVMPISNGVDGHGLNIQMIHKESKPDLIVCHLHKLLPSLDLQTTIESLLYNPRIFGIPVVVICPKEYQDMAQQKVQNLPECVHLTDPADVVTKILELIG